MKKILFPLLILIPVQCFGWGKLGHATIAEMAQRMLTPEANETITKYLDGKPLAEYASWLDIVVRTPPYETEFAGWHASVATAECKSPLWVRHHCRKCRDGVTAMYFFKDYLEDYKSLPDTTVAMSIKCITHIIGDFHCPQHVRYTDEHNEGFYPVTFCGKEYPKYHAVWDTGLIVHCSGFNHTDYKAYADQLMSGLKKSDIKKYVGKGWAREWFEDAATDVRPTAGTVHSGDVLDEKWAEDNYPLAVLEIKKAACQLAAALNYIFGK